MDNDNEALLKRILELESEKARLNGVINALRLKIWKVEAALSLKWHQRPRELAKAAHSLIFTARQQGIPPLDPHNPLKIKL